MPSLRGIEPTSSATSTSPKASSSWSVICTPLQQREGAVLQLHDDAAEGVERRRDLLQLQDHRLVGAEHRAAGDPEDEGVADVAGRSGDGDTDRVLGGCHAENLASRTDAPIRGASRQDAQCVAPRRGAICTTTSTGAWTGCRLPPGGPGIPITHGGRKSGMRRRRLAVLPLVALVAASGLVTAAPAATPAVTGAAPPTDGPPAADLESQQPWINTVAPKFKDSDGQEGARPPRRA